MNVKAILKMGDPQLNQPSEVITNFSDPQLSTLIDEMQKAMKAYGGVGIAAPQIGINKRIILLGFDKNPRYPNEEAIPLTTIINPTYEPLSDEMVDGWEGCLSVPGLRGLVPRYLSIRYQGYSPKGELIQRTVSGFHARIIQHECDHIDGILFPERIKNMKMFGFEEALGEKIY